VKTKHEALLDFYKGVYKQHDNLIMGWCSKDGKLGDNLACPCPCEPHHRTRRLWLYPYERFAITQLSGKRVPPGYVPFHEDERCRFWENGACGLKEHKPLACRMFPAFYFREVPGYIDVYVYPFCQALRTAPGKLIQYHLDYWLSVTVMLMPHMSPRWWAAIASVPRGQIQGRAGVELTGESALNADPTLPVGLCASLHDPFCGFRCDAGVLKVDNELVACQCVQEQLRALEIDIDKP